MKNYTPKKINANMQELKTDEMVVPAVLLTGQKIRNGILEQVEKMAGSLYVSGKAAILSDAHLKENVKSPEGSIVASEGYVLPQMLDTALNCGMRVIKTDLRDSEMTAEKILALFLALQEEIPTKKYFGEIIPYFMAKRTLVHGSEALKKRFGFRIKNEIENTYMQGNFFNSPLLQDLSLTEEEIFKVIPEIFIKMSRYRYGILGATDSHFVSLVKIDSVLDQEVAEKVLGIHEGQYIITMHSGSGIVGRYISYLYSPQEAKKIHKIPVEIGKFMFRSEAEKNYQKVRRSLNEISYTLNEFGLAENSVEGKMCLQAYAMAENIGFANRAVLSHKVDLALEKFFGRTIKLDLLYDAPHVFVDKELHGDKELIIHRNGAVRAQKFEPVYVAPFMNTFGYLGVGTGESLESFNSANHEIGKLEDIDPKFFRELSGEQKNKGDVLIFNKEGVTKVSPEAKHELYAEKIAREMEANKLFKIVARVKPIATLTY